MYTKRGVGKSYAHSRMARQMAPGTLLRTIALPRALFFQPRVLAPAFPQVVELSLTHVRASHDLDLLETWRAQKEGALDADAV